MDFLTAKAREPFLLVEAKLTGTEPSSDLKKFQRALNIPAVQLTNKGAGYRILSNLDQSVLVAPAHQWLSGLP